MSQPLGWKCWVILGGIVLVMGFAIGFLLRANSEWRQKDEALLAYAEEQRAVAQAATVRAVAAEGRADKSDAARSVSDAKLAALLKKRGRRPPPVVLADCVVELDELNLTLDTALESLSLANATIVELRAAADEWKQVAAANLEGWKTTEKRVEGWKRYTRRGKAKQVLFGIGMGIGGYALGVGTCPLIRG